MAILDQHGNPFAEADIAEPQTARIVTLQHHLIESHLDGLDPAGVARALREADQGDILRQTQLFDDVFDKDAHLRSEYEKRQGALLTLDWRIVPPQDASRAEKKNAAWVEEVLRDVVDDLEDVLLHLQEAPGYGFAPVELEWRYIGSERIPTFHPRPQTWFQMGLDRRELRLKDGTGAGQVPVPMGWIMHSARKVKTGYLGRAGIFRPALLLFLYSAYAVGDLAEMLDAWGLPIIVGKYGAGAQPADKSSLMRAVAALGRDARAVMPQDMQVEIMKITGSGDSAPHMALVDWAERAKSKLILGQTLSAEAKSGGLGNGDAALHKEVRSDIRASDARQVAATLTRDLVYPLLAFNRPDIGAQGLRRCPRWEFDLGEAEDIKTYADAVPKLVAVGACIPVAWLRQKLRIPEAAEDEAVLAVAAPAPAPALPPSGAAALTAQTAPGTGLAALAQAARAALAAVPARAATPPAPPDPAEALATQLQTLATPAEGDMLAPVFDLVSRYKGDAAGLQTELVRLYGNLPSDKLQRLMAAAFALAELQGMAAVRAEGGTAAPAAAGG